MEMTINTKALKTALKVAELFTAPANHPMLDLQGGLIGAENKHLELLTMDLKSFARVFVAGHWHTEKTKYKHVPIKQIAKRITSFESDALDVIIGDKLSISETGYSIKFPTRDQLEYPNPPESKDPAVYFIPTEDFTKAVRAVLPAALDDHDTSSIGSDRILLDLKERSFDLWGFDGTRLAKSNTAINPGADHTDRKHYIHKTIIEKLLKAIDLIKPDHVTLKSQDGFVFFNLLTDAVSACVGAISSYDRIERFDDLTDYLPEERPEYTMLQTDKKGHNSKEIIRRLKKLKGINHRGLFRLKDQEYTVETHDDKDTSASVSFAVDCLNTWEGVGGYDLNFIIDWLETVPEGRISVGMMLDAKYDKQGDGGTPGYCYWSSGNVDAIYLVSSLNMGWF